MHRGIWIATAVISLGLLLGAGLHWLPLGLTEVLGFITGAVCVLLVVEQHIWNFPVGIANNLVFIALFLSARLYGDMALQVVYLVLGGIGWYQWLYGGAGHTALRVRRTPLLEAAVLAGIGIIATVGGTWYLARIGDAAPFLDALTTVLSLIAQYLLNGKRLENWFVWIAADVLYIYLYLTKGLYLTAVLYALFIVMCIAGVRAWRAALRRQAGEPLLAGVPPPPYNPPRTHGEVP
jgi:nicotinamide mononucleotide transporter